MPPAIRNILAVVAGFIIGSLVNMGLLMLGNALIPPPAGTDTSTPEGLKAAIPLFEARHFIFPFLAHALGTLAGAYAAGRMSAGRPMLYGLILGGMFLLAGIANVMMLPSPAWFTALDLLGAYLPMGYLGGWWARRSRMSST